MTTLYRPVLIESAEQAERLPLGTSVKRAVWQQRGHKEHYAGVKVGTNTWFTTSPTADLQDALSHQMVGWTALLPIEASEGTDTIQTGAEHFYTRTHYITRWEPVDDPSPDHSLDGREAPE